MALHLNKKTNIYILVAVVGPRFVHLIRSKVQIVQTDIPFVILRQKIVLL